jgi:hypothetical protein
MRCAYSIIIILLCMFDKIAYNLISHIWFPFIDHTRNKIDILDTSKT